MRYSSGREIASKRVEGGGLSQFELPKGVGIFRPKAGTTYKLDIMPYETSTNPKVEKGTFHYERTYYVHKNIGPNQESVLCPAKNDKEACPICEFRVGLNRDDAEEDGLAKALLPKERQLFNVIDLKEPDKGVQLFEMSYYTFGEELDKAMNSTQGEEEGWGYFHTLDEGKTVVATFGEDKMGKTTFVRVDRIDFRDRKPYEDDILDDVIDLDKLVASPSYEEIEKTFNASKKALEDRKERGNGKGDREERGSRRDRDDERSERGGRGDREERGERGSRSDEREERGSRRDRDDDRDSRRSSRDEDNGKEDKEERRRPTGKNYDDFDKDRDNDRGRDRDRDKEKDEDNGKGDREERGSRRDRDKEKDDDKGERRGGKAADEDWEKELAETRKKTSTRDKDKDDDKGKDDERSSRRDRDKEKDDDDRGGRRSEREPKVRTLAEEDREDADDRSSRRGREDDRESRRGRR